MNRALPLVLAALASCDYTLPGYVAKQGFRHGALLLKAESIDEILKRPNLDPKVEHYLRLSKEVLAYASTLGMKTGGSYRKFIQLKQEWVTQVVMAAPKDSLEPHLFNYPIVGALPYRGFYDEDDAIALEHKLAEQNLDVYRRPVEAFSTTGWFPDPVISTMFDSDGRFIELLFHELTHASFYFSNQADFNEAFASWMGFRGALEFVNGANSKIVENKNELVRSLNESHEFQIAYAALVKEILIKGKEFYAQPEPLRQREAFYAWIKERLGTDPKFKRINTSRWNNAYLLNLGTYYEFVTPIEHYASTKGLKPKDFLALVVERGPSIVPEIVGETKTPH